MKGKVIMGRDQVTRGETARRFQKRKGGVSKIRADEGAREHWHNV